MNETEWKTAHQQWGETVGLAKFASWSQYGFERFQEMGNALLVKAEWGPVALRPEYKGLFHQWDQVSRKIFALQTLSLDEKAFYSNCANVINSSALLKMYRL